MPLPIPFPLASGRYEVGPAMRRFGQAGQGLPTEERHFLPDDLLPATLSAKLAVLCKASHESHLVAPDLPGDEEASLRAALRASFHLLAAEHPHIATIDADGVTLHHLGLRVTDWSAPAPQLEPSGDPWPDLREVAFGIRSWLTAQHGLTLLGDTLGLSVQEDLAIVRGPLATSPDLLEWLHVCLPSNWAPAEKIGRSFGAVHEPVVHSERLLTSQVQIVRAMIQSGPFARYVWGIHRDGELCHNPRIHQAAPWLTGEAPADLARQGWFRVERQTTKGFAELNRALFTIRYWVEPLADTAGDPWRRERLTAALANMDEAELAYKGLTSARDHLVQWLVER